MRARYACSFALLITLAACAGKKRPLADTPIEGLAGSSGLGNPAGGPGTAGSSSAPPPEPRATGGEPPGGAPVDGLEGPEGAVQNSGGLACDADPDACKEPDGGPGAPACTPGPRDCTSEVDNDCDGEPDDVRDDVCACLPGAVEPCDEHPGLDGRGPCRAGTRRCVAAEGNVSSDWGACEGAVGPGAADSCEPQDDGDCDGIPNEGCACVDGFTQPCGPATELGRCTFGVQTCEGGFLGQCEGAVFPGTRNCASPEDNDCDGRPDNLIDAVCQCVPGQGNGPCSGNANNARSGASGRCEPCLTDIDCSLVSGGRVSCDDGRCVVPLSPPGASCQTNGECESGRCLSWYRDRDGDRIGDFADEERTCGPLSGVAAPPSGYVPDGGDCCDLGAPNQAVAATINDPVHGAIGIKSRSGGGHVAFVVGKSADGKALFMLGGNQDDRVNIARYDRSVWETFVVPDTFNNAMESLPIYTQPAEISGSEA